MIPEEKDEKFFGNDIEIINGKEWNWKTFKSTKGFPVSKKLLDWVIGQDKVLEEVKLCLDEWIYKLKYLQQKKWYKPWLDPESPKPVISKKLTPGPYLLLLGEPGTGKSLIGRAMAEHLTSLYKKHRIKRFDILCWPNKEIPSNPKISVHPAGQGKVIVAKMIKKLKPGFLKRNLLKIVCLALAGVGLGITSFALYVLYVNIPIFGLISSVYAVAPLFLPGLSLIGTAALIYIFSSFWLSGNKNGFSIGGAKRSMAPKILVDNSRKQVPFIDATGHGSAQLFGSVMWDPYQSGGLGTPEHQRVTAGDIHRAGLGILYIDEIKNLHPDEAITLLTVMEEGCLPIALRSRWHGGDTAAMAVSTEPVPALFFLIAAGNFDSINQIHPALMDRLVGYGRVVRMNNDMPNTIKNRRKYVQFIAQETQRFHLPPFSREACIELINEGRRRSNKRDALTTKFRPLISIIKVAGTLAKNENCKVVKREHVIAAIEEHCKTIQRQILEHEIQERGRFLEINPTGKKMGQIYGLAVLRDPTSGEVTGTVLRVKAQMLKKSRKKKEKLAGFFKVTGIAKDSKWIHHSIDKVRSVILKQYNVDIGQEYFTHIDFAQASGVDGPSAGVTMTLLLCSLLEGKPIRQDVAVTGDINISSEDEIEVTAVGGVHAKIKAAEQWGFSKVVIPKKNLKYSIDPKDYKIKVVGASTLKEYLKEVLE